MSSDFGITIDWLFGRDLASVDGIEVPVYRLLSNDVEAVQSNFRQVGSIRFPPGSPVGGRRYAICANWAESLAPPFSHGEDLLIDLSVQELEEDAVYVIRTSTSTSVRKFRLMPDEVTLKFFRTTPINTYATTYQLHEVNYNADQRFDVEWRQPGCIILGRIEATMRSLLPSSPSFISG